MTQFETLNGQPPAGYHDLQRRAELGRKTSRRLRSEFFGESTKQKTFPLRDFSRKTMRLISQHARVLSGVRTRSYHGFDQP